MTKAVVITPNKAAGLAEINGYDDLYNTIGGLIEPIDLPRLLDAVMWVDEEFTHKYSNDEVNWVASDVCGLGGRPDFMLANPIKGTVVLVGPTNRVGEDTDVTAKAINAVKRVVREAGGEWFDNVALFDKED